ncbi:hypothetical protein PN499_05140 [Kamptonema animale CS-326]|jgi:hypothetical protein|uniref:hypothetical protein n=1 Tax=Kamptonema animale TaxID=92934 RepID=UPI0023305EF6|nr:hypothetical protein [Kamptonema animale]MDB9510563.1 hypothetical protein [Kamptonema animale CS-326]
MTRRLPIILRSRDRLTTYVLGYFDGDGCAYVNKGRSGGQVCIVGSFEFACELAKQIGMVVYNHTSSKKFIIGGYTVVRI